MAPGCMAEFVDRVYLITGCEKCAAERGMSHKENKTASNLVINLTVVYLKVIYIGKIWGGGPRVLPNIITPEAIYCFLKCANLFTTTL